MHLSPYVDELQHQLLVAAEAGGTEARQLAERLLPPLRSASRLVLLDALSAAAGEITSELAPGSVELRLRDRDPEFVVTPPLVDSIEAPPRPEAVPTIDAAPSTMGDTDDGGTSRITLRLREPLKLRIEEAAGREGLSVNAWLVRNLGAVLEPGRQVAGQPGAGRPGLTADHRGPSGGARFTGWARS